MSRPLHVQVDCTRCRRSWSGSDDYSVEPWWRCPQCEHFEVGSGDHRCPRGHGSLQQWKDTERCPVCRGRLEVDEWVGHPY